jgi:hypothetical protein
MPLEMQSIFLWGRSDKIKKENAKTFSASLRVSACPVKFSQKGA